MQRHEGMRHLARPQRCKYGFVKMQPRRGRSNGAEEAGIKGLVALTVSILRCTSNVGRQWYFPVGLEELHHIAGELQHEEFAFPGQHARALSSRESHHGAVLEAFAGT